MQTKTLAEALLVLVFRCARSGRRPNLTAFCRREAVSADQLQGAFELLEARGLLRITPQGESLTLQGLALSAALCRARSARPRPLVACRRLAA